MLQRLKLTALPLAETCAPQRSGIQSQPGVLREDLNFRGFLFAISNCVLLLPSKLSITNYGNYQFPTPPFLSHFFSLFLTPDEYQFMAKRNKLNVKTKILTGKANPVRSLIRQGHGCPPAGGGYG